MTGQQRLAIVVIGTLAIHLAIAAGLASAERPERQVLLFPRVEIELVDLVVEKPKPKEPDPPEPEPEPEPEPVKQPPQRARAPVPQKVATAEPPPVTTSEPPLTENPGPGAPVLRMENLGEGTDGIAVAPGKTTKGRKGSGGSGGGESTGSGSGTGTGSEPVSVASIKDRAKAKDGFDYFDAGKSYPAEARQLGIEGQVRVRLVVDERGRVTATKLLNKLGHGLDELALERAKKLEFHPAIDTDDRPVSSVVVWTFTFTLPA